MRAKNVIMTMVFIALLGFTNLQIRADIPIIKADTVFQGFAGGSVTGIVFTSDPDKVILMHVATPKVIDIKTHQVVIEFQAVPNYEGGGDHTFIVKDKGYLVSYFNSSEILGIKDFAGDVVWDMITGKIIRALPNVLLLTDGNTDRYYTYWNHNFSSYDFETFKLKDSFNLNSIKSTNCEWRGYGIIPNTNKVLKGLNNYFTYKDQSGNWKKEYRLSELYLLDFDTKEFTKIPIPYETWQTNVQILNISVSETGKYTVVSLNIFNVDYYYFFDRNLIFLNKEDEINLRLKTGMTELGSANNICFIEEDYFTVSVQTKPKKYQTLFYDIVNHLPIKVIDFHDINSIYKNNLLVILGNNGILGSQTFEALPVQENLTHPNMFSCIDSKNNNLIINSTASEKVEINITDYTGNLIFQQNDVYLHNGTNTVKMNIQLANGVYFCIIKSANDSDTFKFIVIQ